MSRLQLLGRFLPRSLAGLAVLLGSTLPALAAAGPNAAQLKALETALNGTGELRGVMEDGPGLDVTLVELRRRSLLRQFPDARWQLSPGKPLRDGRSTVQLQVTGSRQEGPIRYRLEAQQQLVLGSSGGRINAQTVIREQSLLRSGEAELPVSLLIPDAVLTGQRYDFDVVLDQPLKDSVLAGGISELSREAIASLRSPDISLGALNGGGIFKTIQAPYKPGSQSWAVLLMHPEGTVSVSRMVRVVARR